MFLLQIWSIKAGWGSRPDISVANSHSDDITGLKFSSDGQILLSRSFDGSLKVLLYSIVKPSLYSLVLSSLLFNTAIYLGLGCA